MTLKRIISMLISGLLVAMMTGCQGSGGQGTLVAEPQAGLGNGQEPVETVDIPSGMPSFGGIAEPVGGPRIVASNNNYILGREASAVSPTGTAIGIDNLLMTSEAETISWALWRWGKFTETVLPETLHVWASVEPGDEYWLFLSDYSADTWEFIGPLNDGSFTRHFNQPEKYLSARGYTYVAMLVSSGNSLDVQHLNIIADKDITPPPAPLALTYDHVAPTTVQLLWQQNFSSGLFRYNLYQGPPPTFELDDAGVEMIGQPESFMTEWPVGGLVPETEYAFCITLLDMTRNESVRSNFVNLTTSVMPDFFPPEGLTVIAVGSSWVDLAWFAPTPEPLGYNAYTGPAGGFGLDDPGIVRRNHGLVESTIWRMIDLEAETDYDIGVQAYYETGESVLSETVSITTAASSPPVPGFTHTPDTILAGEQITFDPSVTTDGDTPLEDLVFKWDFNEDGLVDLTTLGPDEVHWLFHNRGSVTVVLTVSDGTPVSITEDLAIQLKYEYTEVAQATGKPANAVAVDANPTSTRVVALLETDGAYFLRYFENSNWTTLDLAAISADHYCDVALNPTGVSLLTVDFDGASADWDIHEYDSITWTISDSGSQNADVFTLGRMEVSTEGRCTVGIIAAQDVASILEYYVYAWHELSDGSLDASDTMIGSGVSPVLDIQRNTAESRLLYCKDSELRIWTIDDSTSTDLAVQTYSGSPLYLESGTTPEDDTRLFWALATDASRIYYGDNYGEPVQPVMHWDTEFTPSGLLGVGYVGDNASFFAWTETLLDDTQRLLSCAPFPDGGGEVNTLLSGVGAAAGGVGNFYAEDGAEGILTICNEVRDGECVARYLVGDEIEFSENVYSPSGVSNILTNHEGIFLTDGSMVVLAEQEYASARRSRAPYLGASFLYTENGADSWIIPHTACATRYAGEYFTGSFTADSALELNLNVTYGNPGQSKLILPGVSLAQLAYNAFSTDTALCYVANGGHDVLFRLWGGIEWSEPTLVYSGTNTIEALELVGNIALNWGIAWIDSADNTRLAESTLEGWLPARLLSTEPVDAAAGIGLDYNTDGRCCLAVARTATDPGIYTGIIDPGAEVVWERIIEPGGTGTTSLAVYFHLNTPLAVYYRQEAALIDGRMNFIEFIDGAWLNTELPGQLHGTPVDSSRDVMGNIVLAGYRIDGGAQRSACGLLYR